MSKLAHYSVLLWASALIGGATGLFFAWTIRPSFLAIPIPSDSIFRGVPADAPLSLQVISFVGMAVIALVHFTMWVGGSAGLAVVSVGMVCELVRGR